MPFIQIAPGKGGGGGGAIITVGTGGIGNLTSTNTRDCAAHEPNEKATRAMGTVIL